MTPILQHIVLHAIGIALLNSLYYGLVLYAATQFIQAFFQRAATKYFIFLAAQFLLALVFIYQCIDQYATSAGQTALTVSVDNPQQAILPILFSKYINPALANNIVNLLAIAYFAGFLFFIGRWLFAYQSAHKLRRHGLQKADVHFRLFAQVTAGRMNINRKIQVYVSAIAKSPLTVGFLKPVILLPFASFNYLSTEQLEAVILHELAHIRRADYLVHIFQSFAELILFFNPFSYFLSRKIDMERENSCDDWVMQHQYQPALYANALLKIAQMQHATVFAMAASGRHTPLKDRIERLFQPAKKISIPVLFSLAVGIGMLVFIKMHWSVIQPDQADTVIETPYQQTISTQQDDFRRMRFTNIFLPAITLPLAQQVNTAKKIQPKQAEDKTNQRPSEIAIDKLIPEKNVPPTPPIPDKTKTISPALGNVENSPMNIVFASVKQMLDSVNNVTSSNIQPILSAMPATQSFQISQASYKANAADSSAREPLNEAIIRVSRLDDNTGNTAFYHVEIIGNNGTGFSYTLAISQYQ